VGKEAVSRLREKDSFSPSKKIQYPLRLVPDTFILVVFKTEQPFQKRLATPQLRTGEDESTSMKAS
jgi:hypothetical protein